MEDDSIKAFMVRLPRRVVAGLDGLRPAFGYASRASLIRMACEHWIAEKGSDR